MFDANKLKATLKKNKENGIKTSVLAAAGLTIIASGETTETAGANVAPVLSDEVVKLSAVENSAVEATFFATDANGDALTYILSGADADKFSIDAISGKISLKTTANFEAPADADANNTYNVTVTATDSGGLSDSQDAEISISNANEAVSYANAIKAVNVAENQTSVTTSVAIDIDGDVLSYSLSGADAALFTVSSAGIITFKTAPDFETKADAGANGIYDISLNATDGGGLSATQDIAITVTNSNEGVSFANDTKLVNVAENQTTVTTSLATDIDGDVLNYTLSGADAALFNVSAAGVVSFIAAPDFETKADADSNGVYDIILTATDTGGLSATQNIAITLTNLNEGVSFANSAKAIGVAENQTTVTTSLATDLDGNILNYTLSGADAALFNVNTAGVVTFIAAPDFETKADAGANGIYDIVLTATDPDGLSATQNIAIIVTDEAEGVSFASGSKIVSVEENQLFATTSLATDDDGAPITYILSGTDAALFNVNPSGVITFKTTPDFNAPADAGGNNIYDIILTASATDGQFAVQNLTITVTDVGDATLALTALDGTNGFRLDGSGSVFANGHTVSSAGDLNGDGLDDLVIGAPLSNYDSQVASGESYVVYGNEAGFAATISLNTLNGSNGFVLGGQTGQDNLGSSVSSAGDVNGDGFDDLIIGAEYAKYGLNFSGSTYIVFGNASGFGPATNVSSLDGNNGFRLDGVAETDGSGRSVSSAGDVNGDGFDDLIIGAYLADPNGSTSGSTYVLYGAASGFAPIFNLSTLTGATGFRLDGVSNDDFSGGSVSSLGDVNGDGYDDFVIGAEFADPNGDASGSSYVVFGKASNFAATTNLNLLNGDNGFRLDGVFNTTSGHSVSSAGDVNGDGLDDIFVSAHNSNSGGVSTTGASYVIFGKSTGFDSVINLGSINGTNGFRVNGVAEYDASGNSVSSAGDFNGDGYDDLIIGAENTDANGNSSGTSYVVFGKASGFGSTFNLSTLDGSNGFKLDGLATGDHFGFSVSSAGDLNGDGYDDLVVGTPTANSNRGTSYVVFGGGQYAANDAVASAGNDALIGSIGADNINGLAGNDVIRTGFGADTLTGGTGADRLYGGGGADKFVFNVGDSKITIGGANDTGTISGYDTIEDFKVGDGTHNSETLEIVGATNVATAFGNTDSTLTIDSETIKSHSLTDGVVSFDDAASFVTALDISFLSNVAAAVQYLQLQDLGDAGTSVGFDVGADTFIFTQGSDDGANNDLDIVVRLEDVQIDSLVTTLGNGAGDLFLL